MNKPSGWLTAVCITAIVLGSLGVLTGLYGAAMLAVGSAFQDKVLSAPSFGPAAGQMEKQREVQREMQREIQKVADRWKWVTMPLLGMNVVISIGLIVGGVGSLRLRPGGRKLLLIVCWAAIVLELTRLGPTIVIQKETMAVTGTYMSQLMEASAPQGEKMPDEARAMSTVMVKVMSILAIAFAAVLALAQVGFYAFGVIYLRRENIRALFERPVTAELPLSG